MNKHLIDIIKTFSKPDKDQWLKAIESELKNSTWNDHKIRLNDQVAVDPAYLSSSVLRDALSPSDKGNDWKISESFRLQEDLYAESISNALALGLEAPFLINSSNEPWSDHYLDGIFTDFVDCQIVGFTFEEFEKIAKSLNKHKDSREVPIAGGIYPELSSGPELTEQIQFMNETCQELGLSGQFKYLHVMVDSHILLNAADLWIARCLAAVHAIFTRAGKVDVSSRLLISVPVGVNLIWEISKIRALKILLTNLSDYHGFNTQGTCLIHAYSDTSNWSEDVNLNRIQGTLQAWSMVMGGADYIEILPGDLSLQPTNPTSNRRLARNILHIFRMEAQLDKVSDPMAGSYLIEECSSALASSAWKIFVGELENEFLSHPKIFTGQFHDSRLGIY